MAAYNPFDPYATDDPYALPKPKTSYVPQPVGMASPASPQLPDTGIPQQPAQPTYQHPPADDYGGTWQSATGQQTDATHTVGLSVPAPATSTPATTALSGWDQTKWADPAHTTPKYVVGRILSGYPSTPDGLKQALPAIQAAFPGTSLVGLDTLNIPGVGLVDVGVGFSTGGTGWAWQAESAGGGAPAPSMPTAGAAPGAGGATGAAGGFPAALTSAAMQALSGTSSSSTGGADPALSAAVRAMLTQIMGQSPTDINSSPVFQGAISAYDLQQQRGADSMRNAIAERMAAEGTANSGGYSDRLLGAEQQAGEATAQFSGQLAVRELQRQREEIMQALQIGAGLITDQERLQLTEKLGLIDAALQQQSLGLQQQGLGLQQQSITNQNNQFNSTLGWDMAQWPSQQNYLAWLMTQ